MASHGGFNNNITPDVIDDKYGMDDEASRLGQIKKLVIFGVVIFIVVLLITFGIYSTRETTTDVVINNGEIISDGKTAPISPPNQQIQQLEQQPNEQDQPSMSDLPPQQQQQFIHRWKSLLVNNWKIAVPVTVFIVIALVAGIVAVVTINEEQKRAELALAEEAARQLELARQLEEQEGLLQVPSIKSGSIFMTLLTTHIIMSIITTIILSISGNYNIKMFLKVLAAILISGHSFFIIPFSLYVFFGQAVIPKRWGYSFKERAILALLWLVYSVFVVICMPFMKFVGIKMGLMPRAASSLWDMSKDVFERIRA